MDKERKDAINKHLLGVKSGDVRSLELLYEEISPAIWHIALKYLQNELDAEDLVQDFWADIERIAAGFKFLQNGFSYLCKVMTRMALNRYKSLHSRKIKQVQYVDYEKFCLATDDTDSIELNFSIESAMNKLSEKERTIIQLTYFEDKTVREIAKELKISKSQVSELKLTAIDKMKAELDENFVDKHGE